MLGLRRVAWARQVDSMMLMPTSAQMGLIDKRFGGALSKEDVLVRGGSDVWGDICGTWVMLRHGTAAAAMLSKARGKVHYSKELYQWRRGSGRCEAKRFRGTSSKEDVLLRGSCNAAQEASA